jgi:hypothetical protein
MVRFLCLVSVVFLALAAMMPEAHAKESDHARQVCKAKITDVYGLKKFQNAHVEKTGNHKFRVYGQVRYEHHWYDYHCKVKQGYVKSYAYGGPHGHNKDDSDVGTALAVGAGLAIAAAVIAASDDGDEKDLSASKSAMEDECHDILQYRIRDEHDRTAAVKMQETHSKGRDLHGKAHVKYHNGRPHQVNYTCHFDNKGHIVDSSYTLH